MKLHFRYIVGILIGLLILVATFRWSDLKDFTIYLSNIATFTSLALALVAIIISVVAGNAVSRDIGTVSQVTTEVRQSVIQVSGLLSSASQVSEDARRSNAELGTLINDLRREFAASSIQASNDARNSNAELGGLIGNLRDEFAVIRSTSETLAATTQSIGADVATIPGKIEKLEIKIAESTASMKATAGPTPTGATSEAGHLHNLLRRSSPGGELLMYACYLAKKTRKPLNLNILGNLLTNSEYLHGYLMAMSAASFIDGKGGKEAYVLSQVPDEFKEVRAEFERTVAKQTMAATKTKWAKALTDLEAIYAS